MNTNKKYYRNSNYFNSINSNKKAQILGFLYADGYISKKEPVISINLSSIDKQYLEKIQKEIEYQGQVKSYQNNTIAKLLICDIKIYEDLINLGCLPQKSLILKFPDRNQVSEEFIQSFILGYLEGDGWITVKYRQTGMLPTCQVGFCVTKEFGESLKEVLNKINIKSSLKLVNKYKNIKNPPNVYSLSITGFFQVNNFLNWIYKNVDEDFVLERKYNKWIQLQKFIKWREENWLEIKEGHKNRMNESIKIRSKKRYTTIWLINQAGKIYKITGINPFVREYCLDQGSITKVFQEKSRSHKGWTKYDIETLGIPSSYIELNY